MVFGKPKDAFGAIDGVFNSSSKHYQQRCYASQVLIPVLPKKSVLIMDNANFRADMITAIEESGTLLEFLPPYSPQPIERKWAQAKAICKRERCDVDTLFAVLEYDKL